MFSIMLATLISFFVAIVMYLLQRVAPVAEIMDSFLGGARMMVYATLILISAWSIKQVCDELGTAPYIVSALEGVLSPLMLPILTFIVSCFVSLFTGTSWGTMGIVVPIVIPLAVSVGAPLPIVISSVLTGAVMGDHCSPISDTTIMSSTFSGSDHMDHVKTQFPYSLLVTLVAIFCYLIAGMGISVYLVLLVGAIVLYLLILVLSSISAKQLGITFPLEK